MASVACFSEPTPVPLSMAPLEVLSSVESIAGDTSACESGGSRGDMSRYLRVTFGFMSPERNGAVGCEILVGTGLWPSSADFSCPLLRRRMCALMRCGTSTLLRTMSALRLGSRLLRRSAGLVSSPPMMTGEGRTLCLVGENADVSCRPRGPAMEPCGS
jgi:hypothetical protein